VGVTFVHDENALFDEDEAEDEIVLGRDNKLRKKRKPQKQRLYSLAKVKPEFEA